MLMNGVAWILSHFSFALFILALILVFLQKTIFMRRVKLSESLYSWVTLLPLGIGGLYGFALHAFFPDFTAATIGWQNSPFQYEVAMANLGFGLVALLAFQASFGFRVANVVGITCWLWGDAAGHLYQMIIQHNFSSGNAGTWLWMDIICPFILIICIIRLRHSR